MTDLSFFATSPRNLERLVADELTKLGAREVQHTRSGVHFKGTLETGYRAVLWSRVANSILLNIAEIPAADPDELYAGVRTIKWSDHLSKGGTLKVSFTSVRSEITHTQFGALRVKDAIVDQFRERTGQRPSIDLSRPDLHVNCHVDGTTATLSVDLAGDSLHRRGYRQDQGPAPLKENIAAAVLLRANWPHFASEGRPLLDPMCGSGTLLIEAAMMAADQAPSLHREFFGLTTWLGHDQATWKALRTEAGERARAGLPRLATIQGSDIDPTVLKTARVNASHAGLEKQIHFQRRPLSEIEPPAGRGWPGLLVTNAPYGERLGTQDSAMKLHSELGQVLIDRFGGWQASILTGSQELGKELGLSADKVYNLFNGRLECILLNIRIFDRQ